MPVILMRYDKAGVTPACDEDDLPIGSIKKIDFSTNKFPNMKENIIKLELNG